jgi:drug/metabolite transporter (DMT)-like permease
LSRAPETASQRTYLAGVFLLLLAAILWSLNGAFIKVINQGGQGPDGLAIAFYRSIFGGLFLLPFSLVRNRTGWGSSTEPAQAGFAARTNTRWPLIACVLSFTLMTTCFVIANTLTQAANAIILQYTSTLWVFLFSPLLLGESANRRDLWILLVAIAGIGVIFAGNAGTSLPGLLIALAAGLFYGLLTLFLRKLRHIDAVKLTVINNLGAAALLLPVTILLGDIMLPTRTLALLLMMGVIQFSLPYLFFSLGLKRVPAHQAALYTMLEPLLVPLWTYLAVGEVPIRATFFGGTLILAALSWLTFASWRRSAVKQNRDR